MSKINPAVTIFLDKERHLRMTMNAMVDFEEMTGQKLTDPKTIESFSSNMDIKHLRALLWALLRHEDKTLTVEQVGDLIEIQNMTELSTAIAAAWGNAVPEAPKDAAPLATPPLSGTG